MKGILFKPESIKAIIEGRKTQTRRVIKGGHLYHKDGSLTSKYQVGEVVYVKEAWCESYYGKPICYKADGHESPGPKGFWRSPMFLKAINARYFIKITGMRAERLQEITEEDAKAEGVSYLQSYNLPEYIEGFRGGFKELWNSINPNARWESNPWVFVYSFKLEMPGD